MTKMTVKQKKNRLSVLIASENQFSFPEFITALRLFLIISRNKVSGITGITPEKIHQIENGLIKQYPESEIEILCEFYGVDKEMISKKCKSYLMEKYKAQVLGIS